MTRGDFTKIVAAALIGGAVTYIVGPFVKRSLDKYNYGSYWAGEWATVSCHENGTYTYWDLALEQDGNRVVGRYKGAKEATELTRGRLAGEVNLSELNGDWSSHKVNEFSGGSLNFVLVESGNAFEGTYISGETQRIWNGRRDGKEPICK